MTGLVPSTSQKILVRTFYGFTQLSSHVLRDLKSTLSALAKVTGLRGSVLLAEEGVNGTIAGDDESVTLALKQLQSAVPHLTYQDSRCETPPFRRWKILDKPQIVAARDQVLCPPSNHDDQLDAQQWDEIRKSVRLGTAQMLDVRNSYEVEIGTFPEAQNPQTATFKEFSDFLDREVGQSLDPKLPTAIFCTGGIRCEKARLDLERRGFRQVLQLHQGILGYLREQPQGGFQGECFVFDERVALDAQLKPSRIYELCPTCGNPRSHLTDHHICDNHRRHEAKRGSLG